MVVVASPFVRETLARSLRALGRRRGRRGGLAGRGPGPRPGHRRPRPRVVDGTLPDGSGIALVRELRGLGWVRGLVLSSTEDPYTVRAALAAGVRAFLVTASSGGPASRSAAPQPSRPAPGRPGSPAPRRCPAARSRCSSWSSDGRSNKEIGEALGLSALTVKSHLARIARKLGTGDRAEMVVVAMRAGVVV